MTFSRALFGLFLVGTSIVAVAADKPGRNASRATQDQILGSQSTASSDVTALTNPFSQGRTNSDPLALEKKQPRGRSLSELNGDVCYTMRSYKVKRTERLKDDQTGLRGYSTCEKASDYQFRSADAKAKDSGDGH